MVSSYCSVAQTIVTLSTAGFEEILKILKDKC